MSELPEGWIASTFGELCDVVSGSTPRTTVPDYWNGEIAWITPDDLSRLGTKTIARGARSITQAGYESCSTTLLPTGTVLYSSRAPIGYAAIATGLVCTNQGFKSFVPSGALTSDYLYWYLVYATPSIRKLGSGTTFPELSKTAAKTIELPLPPLAEQRRIVAAIEEHFSRLDAAEQSLRRAQRRLDQLKAASLEDLLDPTWPQRKIAEVGNGSRNALAIGPFGSNLKVSDYQESGVPLIFVRNIRAEEFSGSDTHFVSDEKALELAAHVVRSGDVLVTKMGEPPGDSTVYPSAPNAILTADCIKISVAPDFEPRFVAYVIRSARVRRQIIRITSGVAQKKVSLARFKTVTIPAPPLADQRRIVAEVERRLSLVDALAAATAAALKRSAALRRSILERAFSGKLVPQNPSDEPASVLLERIRAERATETNRAPRGERKTA